MQRTPLTVTLCGLVGSTSAALITFPFAPGLVYDDVQDITWLVDANYAGTTGVTPDGIMNWFDAHTFANTLAFESGGITYDNWRLPFTDSLDNAPGVVSGELGQLHALYGITVVAPGPFINLEPEDYWYGPEFDATQGLNFTFDPSFIGTYRNLKDSTQFSPRVMPVFDGPPIPAPATVLLIAPIASVRRRR